MAVLKIHWLFKERFNKLDSNNYRDLTPMQIDQLINDAVFIFLENHVFPELHQQKFDMVSNLIVTQPEQPSITPVSENENVYEFSLSSLAYPYLHYKRAFVKTNCGNYYVQDIVGHGRLNDVLSDNFQKPSKKWRRLIGSFAKSSTSTGKSLYIYSDKDFEVESLDLEYVRKPKQVFLGGYDSLDYLDCIRRNGTNCNSFNSSQSTPQDLEIDETYHSLVVDYAVKEAARILKDVNNLQLNQEKINSIINA